MSGPFDFGPSFETEELSRESASVVFSEDTSSIILASGGSFAGPAMQSDRRLLHPLEDLVDFLVQNVRALMPQVKLQ